MPMLEQHKLIKDYVKDLAKIVDVRENLEGQIEEIQQNIFTVNDENKLVQLNNRITELQAEIENINVLGRSYIQKIDKLNGVK